MLRKMKNATVPLEKWHFHFGEKKLVKGGTNTNYSPLLQSGCWNR